MPPGASAGGCCPGLRGPCTRPAAISGGLSLALQLPRLGVTRRDPPHQYYCGQGCSQGPWPPPTPRSALFLSASTGRRSGRRGQISLRPSWICTQRQRAGTGSLCPPFFTPENPDLRKWRFKQLFPTAPQTTSPNCPPARLAPARPPSLPPAGQHPAGGKWPGACSPKLAAALGLPKNQGSVAPNLPQGLPQAPDTEGPNGVSQRGQGTTIVLTSEDPRAVQAEAAAPGTI